MLSKSQLPSGVGTDQRNLFKKLLTFSIFLAYIHIVKKIKPIYRQFKNFAKSTDLNLYGALIMKKKERRSLLQIH